MNDASLRLQDLTETCDWPDAYAAITTDFGWPYIVMGARRREAKILLAPSTLTQPRLAEVASLTFATN